MNKVLVINISTRVTDGTLSDKTTNIEFEPIELNKFLSEGWVIEKYDIVPSNVATNFSIIYQLVKKLNLVYSFFCDLKNRNPKKFIDCN